jgi:DNA polymerase III subunit beta
MEFRIDRDTFSKALQKIQGIVEKRNTMPILSNALLEVSDNTLSVTATDLEVGMKSMYPVNMVQPGKITISAKKIFEIIKELPDKEIVFSTKENDWVEICCGKSKFTIVGLSSEEFPYFPKVGDQQFVAINSALLSEMIEKTSYAICTDETKYNLNGVYVKIAEENGKTILRMVATDGHRLSIAEKEVSGTFAPELQKGVIFPRKGIHELRRLSEEGEANLMLGFMDNSGIIRKDQTVIVMRLVDGDFPDYTRVIPVANDKRIRINRDELLHALKRMSILSSEKFKGIKCDFNGNQLEISSSNPELGEGHDGLDIVYDGPQMTSRFNARYIIDVLSILTEDEIELVLKDEMSPAILQPYGSMDFRAVVMPMRL